MICVSGEKNSFVKEKKKKKLTSVTWKRAEESQVKPLEELDAAQSSQVTY